LRKRGALVPRATVRLPNATNPLSSHLWPQPRIKQGLWLSHHHAATAAIDLSDGLSTDLDHLCHESGVSAVIDAAALPLHPRASLHQAMHGGEDYELLFTARSNATIPRRISGVAVTQIGTITKKRAGHPSVILIDESGLRRPLPPEGWQHFS
jgi:thiamine-monophosphate kinase